MEKENAPRITPQEARRKLDAGEAILVCAYEADEKFRDYRIEEAESLTDFMARLPEIPKGQEIIFYCA